MKAITRGFWLGIALMLALVSLSPAQNAAPGKLRIIAFGAHPDDPEFKAGGCAILWSKLGHEVKLVSVTNGDIGHWREAGGPLAIRRTREAQICDKLLGAVSQVLDIHDGELEPTLENRKTITRLIREWNADIVIAPRPWDYHPDHRYVGVLVQDAAYMVAVPFITPDVPPLKKNPVFLYSSDGFKKPYPFQPDIAVDLDEVIEQKWDGIHELESQVYELGALGNAEDFAKVPPPSDKAGRRAFMKERYGARLGTVADQARESLIRWYGPERGKAVKNCEAFEICEYGRQPSDDEIRQLFPFLPKK